MIKDLISKNNNTVELKKCHRHFEKKIGCVPYLKQNKVNLNTDKKPFHFFSRQNYEFGEVSFNGDQKRQKKKATT